MKWFSGQWIPAAQHPSAKDVERERRRQALTHGKVDFLCSQENAPGEAEEQITIALVLEMWKRLALRGGLDDGLGERVEVWLQKHKK